ncbi:CBS domain-containing protein [Sediminispirochaeta smaragdinae]|jgi:CBS domain-containing protein|uniref:Signal transduction protein with CBS domains n=1 Tax=Sediminispirochaeta smaragdinae (strain DSM 11293 / JCM 15392 / SEBR 4228) TaxID=573413 RepID=E1R428_SEDSS|nr:CBS domain-containing protein [Sediminispirochaeta smaragdinae]ADK80450.1 putative signal transduction protein with CBS domains [Sediminispirochaeta smaragdinae DSM 11293]
METIKDLLAQKGADIWSVRPETTVFQALSLMSEKNVGAVVVLDDQQKMIGIFSERDYARKTIGAIGSQECPRDLPVKELMTTEVVAIKPETGVETCMALMTKKRFRHLPVMENNALIGIISIGDIVKAVITEKDFLIAKMEQYIWDN